MNAPLSLRAAYDVIGNELRYVVEGCDYEKANELRRTIMSGFDAVCPTEIRIEENTSSTSDADICDRVRLFMVDIQPEIMTGSEHEDTARRTYNAILAFRLDVGADSHGRGQQVVRTDSFVYQNATLDALSAEHAGNGCVTQLDWLQSCGVEGEPKFAGIDAVVRLSRGERIALSIICRKRSAKENLRFSPTAAVHGRPMAELVFGTVAPKGFQLLEPTDTAVDNEIPGDAMVITDRSILVTKYKEKTKWEQVCKTGALIGDIEDASSIRFDAQKCTYCGCCEEYQESRDTPLPYKFEIQASQTMHYGGFEMNVTCVLPRTILQQALARTFGYNVILQRAKLYP